MKKYLKALPNAIVVNCSNCGLENLVNYTRSEVECMCGRIDFVEVIGTKIKISPVKDIPQ